jgi:hypothetical protein
MPKSMIRGRDRPVSAAFRRDLPIDPASETCNDPPVRPPRKGGSGGPGDHREIFSPRANWFTEWPVNPALPYVASSREQAHVLFNILLIYS